MKIETIAKVCHQVNKVYCESLDDFSQMDWDQAPPWQRESAINGVEFTLKEGASPESQHENWCEEKLRNGWVHGPIKDAIKKTHPCLVSYESLPEKQKYKDRLFRAVVLALKEEVE